MLSDEELMMAFGGGDLKAFDELYHRHRNSLYRYLLRQLAKPVAEDMFQDIWASVVRYRKKYQPRAAFKTWLFTIANNRLTDHWRDRRPALTHVVPEKLPEPSTGPDGEPDTQLESLRSSVLLRNLIRELPEEQRTCFLLKHEAGLTLAEIAEITRATPETTKSRLRYAMAKLRLGLEVMYAD